MLLRSMRSQALQSSRAMSAMPLTFAAPNGVHYNAANVKQIDVQGYDCAFGILPTHVPTIAILAPGVVTVYEEDGAANKFFASSGTVTVNEDGRYLCYVLLVSTHKMKEERVNFSKISSKSYSCLSGNCFLIARRF